MGWFALPFLLWLVVVGLPLRSLRLGIGLFGLATLGGFTFPLAGRPSLTLLGTTLPLARGLFVHCLSGPA